MTGTVRWSAWISNRDRWRAALILATVPAWFVGLDQAIWLVAAAAMAAYPSTAGARRFVVPAIAFLFVVALAGAISVTGLRQVVVLREWLIVGAFTAVVTGMAVRRPDDHPLLAPLTSVLVISSGLTLLAFLLQRSFEFTTPVAQLVPADIAGTGLGRLSLVERSLAEPSFFVGQSFLRPKGLFLFSTSQAVAAAVWVPIVLFKARIDRRHRWAWRSAAAVIVAALVATTTRVPILALLVGLSVPWLATRLDEGRIRIEVPFTPRSLLVYVPGAAIVLVLALESGALNPLMNALTSRSLEGRAALYAWTVDAWRDRPLLGWGSEVDPFPTPSPALTPRPTAPPASSPSPRPTNSPTTAPRPEDRPPLGSHSQYLGVLFKQGLLGLVVFAWLLRTPVLSAARVLGGPGYRRLIAAALGTGLVAGITESLWLDPATAVYVAAGWGLVIAAASQPQPQQSDELHNRG